MRGQILRWVLLLFGGGLLFGAEFSGCMADVLRESSDYLNEAADDFEDEDEVSDMFEDIEDWFD